MKKLVILLFCAFSVQAEEMEVMGNVASKCVVTPNTAGVFGNPTADVLSTDPTDGGVDPVVRFDVIQASSYKARISYPTSFSESPTLNDTVVCGYDAAKVEFDNVTEFSLTVAGSTWFKTESQADYGYGKAFPGGVYRAIVSAECIAI